jgi:hypothetical protein
MDGWLDLLPEIPGRYYMKHRSQADSGAREIMVDDIRLSGKAEAIHVIRMGESLFHFGDGIFEGACFLPIPGPEELLKLRRLDATMQELVPRYCTKAGAATTG